MNTGTCIYIAPVKQKSSEARLSCPVWQCFAAVKKERECGYRGSECAGVQRGDRPMRGIECGAMRLLVKLAKT